MKNVIILSLATLISNIGFAADRIISTEKIVINVSPRDFKCLANFRVGYGRSKTVISTKKYGEEHFFASKLYEDRNDPDYTDCSDYDFFLQSDHNWVLRGIRETGERFVSRGVNDECLKYTFVNTSTKLEGTQMKFISIQNWPGKFISAVDRKYCKNN